MTNDQMPGALGIMLWGLVKTKVLTKKQAITFRKELSGKKVPVDTELMLEELESAFKKAKLGK